MLIAFRLCGPVVFVGAIATVFFGIAINAYASVEVLVSSGDSSPDGNGQFLSFGTPSLGNTGHAAFYAMLEGTSAGDTDAYGAFRIDPSNNGSPTNIVQIARTGDLLSGSPVLGFANTRFYVDDVGFVNGTMVLGPSSETSTAAFRGNGATLVDLVPKGSASPTGDNALFGFFTQARSPIGDFVYRALYFGENVENGLYSSSTEGVVTTKILYGDPAPGGGVINSAGGLIAVTEQLEIATFADITEEGNNFDSLLRISPTNEVTEIVREGELLSDGLTTINQFVGFQNALMHNSAGAFAFVSEYQQPGIVDEGVFVADDTGIHLVAGRSTTQSMDVGRDIELVGLSDTNQAIFRSDFGFITTIQIANSGSATVVAFEEMQLPELGKAIRHLPVSSTASNSSGEIAFLADLSDEVGGSISGQALFRYTDQTGLAPIVQTGDQLDGGIISEIEFGGNQSNNSFFMPAPSLSGLNNSGQIAFAYELDNGDSGIAIWSPDIATGDFTLDGDINGDDFLAWQRDPSLGSLTEWQAGYGNESQSHGVAVIPEPDCIVLILIALTVGGQVTARNSKTSRTAPGLSSVPQHTIPPGSQLLAGG